MAKLHMNFNLPFDLPGLVHSITGGLQELEHDLKDCKTPNDLEQKLKDLEAGFEARLKDTFSCFMDPSMDPSVATNGRDNGIDVQETAQGWLLSAYVPGVSSEQCAVTVEEDGEQSRLKLYITRAGNEQHQRRLLANYVKPARLVDAASVTASCIDGVLRVAVPKVAPTERLIPVVSGEPTGEGEAMTLHVPGYAAADLALTLRLPARELIVEGCDTHMGHFRSRAVDLPEGGDDISASCHNGILTMRFTAAPAAACHTVSVSDTVEANDDTNLNVILEKPVPGKAAADISVEVDPASRCVKVTASGKSGCLMLLNSLPQGVDPSTVRASCADGLLRVTAAAPASPAEHNIVVSTDQPAHVDGGGDSRADKAAEDAKRE